MPTLGDIARQASAPPAPTDQPPAPPQVPTLGDVARQAAAPPPEQQPAITITPPLPSPSEQPRGSGPWRDRYQFGDEEEPAPPPARATPLLPSDVHPVSGGAPATYRVAPPERPTSGKPPGPWAEGYEYPDPNAVREPTWGETIGLGALQVVPPLVVGGAAAPFLGPAAAVPAALAGTLSNIAKQRYEVSHGLRREVRPYESIVSGIVSGIPGFEIAPEAPLVTRAGARALEGAGINVGADVAETGLEEHRLPTLGEVARTAATGAAFGGVAGTAEHGVLRYHAGRAPEAAPEVMTRPGDQPIGGGVQPGEVAPPVEGFVGPPAPEEFVGPPAPEAPPPPKSLAAIQAQQQAAREAERAPRELVGPPAPEAAPPAVPPPSPAPVEPEPRYPPPVFRRAPGYHEALTGEAIPEAVPRPPERLAGELAAVDRLFPNHPEESRQALKDLITAHADDIADRDGLLLPGAIGDVVGVRR